MCRLFGLTAGRRRIDATFWLLDAPDNLRRQSLRNPDGTGLGTFDEHDHPVVEKQPLSAVDDAAFATEAKVRRSSTFVAHVRRSSGTPVSEANTHPFSLDGRCFAHNGTIGGLDPLERHLGPDLSRVHGDTDSERLFALITREIEQAGDIGEGIGRAMAWVIANLPVTSANFILTVPHELWALRYPEHNELWLLDRRSDHGRLRHRSGMGMQVHSDHLEHTPSVVVASEPLDDDDWVLLEPGELLHIDADLAIAQRSIRA